MISLLVCSFLSIMAQKMTNPLEEYEKKRQESMAQYDENRNKSFEAYMEFRRSANEAYTRNMREAWAHFTPEEPLEMETLVEPPQAPECTNSFFTDAIQFIGEKLHRNVTRRRQPTPFEPKPQSKTSDEVTATPKPEYKAASIVPFRFNFYNTPCSVRIGESQKFSLISIQEWDVAAVWSELSKASYDLVINDCLWLRDSLQLSGWGYYSMLKSLSDAFLGAGTNESMLFQTYLLMQSGYKVRIGKSGDHLIMLMPSDYNIFSRKSLLYPDGTRYYIFGECRSGDTYSLYPNPFPREETLSLRMDNLPLLAEKNDTKRVFASHRYPDLSVQIASNKNMIDFFNDYPVNDNWSLYSISSLRKETKDVLYPKLKEYIEGKSEQEAANILIDFVQTAFEYKTDNEQFGYERPLFGDETFFYPYSDCEDRSILFSILVRDLLNLDVVFIYYPRLHLSTAVKFSQEVPNGSYVMYEDEKYTICDPTYIHSRIGMVHSSYRNLTLNIVPID